MSYRRTACTLSVVSDTWTHSARWKACHCLLRVLYLYLATLLLGAQSASAQMSGMDYLKESPSEMLANPVSVSFAPESAQFSARLAPQNGSLVQAGPEVLRIPSLSPVDSFLVLAEEDEDDDAGDGGLTFNGVRVAAVVDIFQRKLPHLSDDRHGDGGPVNTPSYRYHWSGLIAESLFFNVVESSFRIASDDQIRNLLAHKPFWHDYIASLHQFNMRRWNDGDDFLVNYVGHPLQGAVSGFIEIQNDPAGRQQEISKTRTYWMSRYKAFLWATVYSTHSEISPLGEAGIGNEGGWTYPISPVARKYGSPRARYTNNTGWVDFIVTPTVGTLWLLFEDTLDRYVSDRIQGDDRSHLFPKIVRGTLNPSRTMANAMRFKPPWYRDFQHSPELDGLPYGVHFLKPEEDHEAVRNYRRFTIAPYFRSLSMPSVTHRCTHCNSDLSGGIEAEYALTRGIAASFAVGRQQGFVDSRLHGAGSHTSLGFGVRFAHDGPHNSLSLALQPGMVIDYLTIPAHVDPIRNIYIPDQQSSSEHGTVSVMVSNDYKLSRFLAMRFSFGDTIVRYSSAVKTPPGVGQAPHLSWMSHNNYTNRSTWISEWGPVIHF
jgi:hypothetical protein